MFAQRMPESLHSITRACCPVCSFREVDIALFCAGGAVSKQFAPLAVSIGVVVSETGMVVKRGGVDKPLEVTTVCICLSFDPNQILCMRVMHVMHASQPDIFFRS